MHQRIKARNIPLCSMRGYVVAGPLILIGDTYIIWKIISCGVVHCMAILSNKFPMQGKSVALIQRSDREILSLGNSARSMIVAATQFPGDI